MELLLVYFNLILILLYLTDRQKEEEERRNKMDALAAVRAAKAAISANVVVPEEVKSKQLPSIIPKTVITPSNDDKTSKPSKDM